jgi:asparagine synthase (glutamine-hydrolysing)
MKEFSKYRFDKSGTIHDGSIFLGCHQNQITLESLNEALPYESEDGSLVITADAIIDNREELLGLLSVTEQNRDLTDSLLILRAYQKWGIDCPGRLVGDFAFASWDKQKNELFCARDHVGQRSLYYYHDQAVFAFATIINPLFKITGIKKRLNEIYIADFLAIPNARHEIDAGITIYEDIDQLPLAHAMVVKESGVKQWRYWEIKKTKEIKFDTDVEYEEAFRKVYTETVR